MAMTGSTPELTFIGTATCLLRIGPFTLLTDPNFLHRGERASLGYGMWSKRRTEPAMQPQDLPRLDAVVLSHLHGDHFDRRARHGLSRDVPVVTTPHAARVLRRWGFRRADGFDPWSATRFTGDGQTLTITSVPGTHAPGPLNLLLPKVMGTVVEWETGAGTRPWKLYLTGDTLYRSGLAAVLDRFGTLDAMVIHLGGTRILGITLTMDARQGVELIRLLEPRLTVPVHFDDYGVFKSPRADFLRLAAQSAQEHAIRPVERGQTIPLASSRIPM